MSDNQEKEICSLCGRPIDNKPNVRLEGDIQRYHALETPEGEPAPKGVMSCWELSEEGKLALTTAVAN